MTDDLGIKKYVIHNFSTGIVKTIINLLFAVIAIPIIIKQIGLSSYGVISLVLIFGSFSGFLDLGLSKSLIIFSGKQNNNSSKEITAIYLINIAVFIFLVLCSLLTLLFNFNFLGDKIKLNSNILTVINSVALLLLGLNVLNNLFRAELESNFKYSFINIGYILQSSILNLGWLILALYKVPIKYFLFIPLLGSFVVLIYQLIIIFTDLLKKWSFPHWINFKNVINTTIQFFKLGFLNTLHVPLIKLILIYFIGSTSAVGVLEVTMKITGLSKSIISYITTPIFSVSSYNKNKIKLLLKITKKVTVIAGGLSLIGYFLFLLFNKYVILFIYKEYSSLIFRILNYVLIAMLLDATIEGIKKYNLGLENFTKLITLKAITIIINVLIVVMFIFFGLLNFETLIISYSFSISLIAFIWLFTLRKKDLNLVIR